MKIFRMIDGKPIQIELTGAEMTEAYYEQQVNWDRARVYDVLDIAEKYDIIEKLAAAPELVKKVAMRFRKYYEDYPTGEAELDCMLDAVNYVFKNIPEI